MKKLLIAISIILLPVFCFAQDYQPRIDELVKEFNQVQEMVIKGNARIEQIKGAVSELQALQKKEAEIKESESKDKQIDTATEKKDGLD